MKISMHWKTNKKLHEIALKIGWGHDELKKAALRRFGRYYETLSDAEGHKMYYEMKSWYEDKKKERQRRALERMLPNAKLKMTNIVNVLLHKKGHSLGLDHKRLMATALQMMDKAYNELNDFEAWKLYYILSGNDKKLKEMNKSGGLNGKKNGIVDAERVS